MLKKKLIKEENGIRKVYLDNLPKKKNGNVDWRASVGHNFKFNYDGLEDYIEIIGYKANDKIIQPLLKYKDKEQYVYTQNINKCWFSELIGKSKDTYLYKIGDIIKTENQHFEILDIGRSNVNARLYKVKCLNCGFNGFDYYDENKVHKTDGYWIRQTRLTHGALCPCCSCGCYVSKDINSIYATNKEMFELLANKEDGYKYTENSSINLKFKCPNCGFEKLTSPSNVKKNGFACQKCTDGYSMGEKYFSALLNQINIEYITQYSPKWINTKRYDFFLPKYNTIVEIHGEQHRRQVNGAWNISVENQQKNDSYKKEIALYNGISNYIEIDYNTYDYDGFKNNILNSELNNLLNLSNIDWSKCINVSNTSLLLYVCDLWNNKNKNDTLKDVRNKSDFKIDRHTFSRYLKMGAELGLCNYKPCNKRAIIVLKDNIIVGEFDSILELLKNSKKIFGAQFNENCVRQVCKGERENYKGYNFKYA